MAATKPRARATDRQRRRDRTGLLLFVLAFALRLLFWQATPDAAWPYSAYYKGDALTWTAHAAALHQGEDYELGLPLRPPGAAYLIAALWEPRDRSFTGVKLVWCLLGAVTVTLVHGAVRRGFGARVALATGLITALSSGLLMLSTSLENETPYLFLVAASFRLWPRLSGDPGAPALLAWGSLHALACLFRVEHLLVALLTSAWIVAARAENQGHGRARRFGLVASAFVLVLLPWHVVAWTAIHRFNTEEPERNPATVAAQAEVERSLAGVAWTADALRERDRMPAFARRAASTFVTATVAHRGGGKVDAADLAVLDEAFHYRPEPLAYPFVALYGPLNFHLAFHSAAEVGFSRRALDEPPPLDGGHQRYPALLVEGLPPANLALEYPPHLRAVNRGWKLGRDWIAAQPASALRLAGRRLVVFWTGATLGFGGYGAPFGLSGLRPRADLVVPDAGPALHAWQLAWLALAATGLWAGLAGESRRHLVPWLALLATKVVVSVAFFGYARHGATAVPVVALLAALAADRLFPSRDDAKGLRRWTLVALAVAVLALGAETVRWASPPRLVLDGRPVVTGDPWPGPVHRDRRLVCH